MEKGNRHHARPGQETGRSSRLRDPNPYEQKKKKKKEVETVRPLIQPGVKNSRRCATTTMLTSYITPPPTAPISFLILPTPPPPPPYLSSSSLPPPFPVTNAQIPGYNPWPKHSRVKVIRTGGGKEQQQQQQQQKNRSISYNKIDGCWYVSGESSTFQYRISNGVINQRIYFMLRFSTKGSSRSMTNLVGVKAQNLILVYISSLNSY